MKQGSIRLFNELKRLAYQTGVCLLVREAKLVHFLYRVWMPHQSLPVVLLFQLGLGHTLHICRLIKTQPFVQTSLLKHRKKVISMLIVKSGIFKQLLIRLLFPHNVPSRLHLFLNVLHFLSKSGRFIPSKLRRVINRELLLEIGQLDRFYGDAG